MGWILLFALSFILIGGMIIGFYHLAKESDTQYKDTRFSRNQILLFCWVIAILICVLAAGLEYLIVIR